MIHGKSHDWNLDNVHCPKFKKKKIAKYKQVDSYCFGDYGGKYLENLWLTFKGHKICDNTCPNMVIHCMLCISAKRLRFLWNCLTAEFGCTCGSVIHKVTSSVWKKNYKNSRHMTLLYSITNCVPCFKCAVEIYHFTNLIFLHKVQYRKLLSSCK